MSIRVIQWGAGKNGAALIRAVAAHQDLELVGCRIYSDAKNGVDAGELAGMAPLGVRATNDRASILALDADVVLHCPRLSPDMDANDRDVCDLLRSGKNVISVSGAHSMPNAIPGYAAQFEDACRAGGTTFVAAGVNPGFIAERLAPTLTGLCTDVSSITVSETYQCQGGGSDLLFGTMRFGDPLAEWSADSPVGRMFDHLFTQLVYAMAEPLGIELESVRRTVEVAPLPADVEAGGQTVARGTVGGIGQSWEGVPKDARQITLRKQTRWVISDDILGWEPFSGWRIDIEGKPSLRIDVRIDPAGDRTYEPDCMVGGAIPMIAEVMKAPPGLLRPTIFAPFRKRLKDC